MAQKQKHLVLVHGVNHGAWCWYKVKPLLEATGHRVTALDMAASGRNPKRIDDVNTLDEYSEPLQDFLASLPLEERVVLVGHSFGGMNIAHAMELYPEKISCGVFLSALMPDTRNPPSFVVDTYLARIPRPLFLDTKFEPYCTSPEYEKFLSSPIVLATNVYNLSPVEDYELAKTLVRPSSFLLNDLRRARNFTRERYGSVKRVYITAAQDFAITIDYQYFMIANYLVDQVLNVGVADHMSMFSNPKKLSAYLSYIALNYT